ncbi:MAG: ParA family protein [Maritimibacter sp.]|nr:ParA family protein [Maritimibacter sp.]
MKKPILLSVFNNKGGVGKTTLSFHLAHALAQTGTKVLAIDLDPQCNLTIFSIDENKIAEIWEAEDAFIESYEYARNALGEAEFSKLTKDPRSIHFVLKPTEDGTAEPENIPPPLSIARNLSLIPGRLTLHLFEAKVGERWSGVYQGDPLSIKTATRIRTLALEYAKREGFDIVLLDTSPSLGALNRNILSLADAFIVPGGPDLFSIYGIRNIGAALRVWKGQFESIFHFLSKEKRSAFPDRFVRFVGYTLFNAKKLTGQKSTNNLGLASAHYKYAVSMPDEIFSAIDRDDMANLEDSVLRESIGESAVIYTNNTYPSQAQTYHTPMWDLPSCPSLSQEDKSNISGNRKRYEEVGRNYRVFAKDLLKRLEALDE